LDYPNESLEPILRPSINLSKNPNDKLSPNPSLVPSPNPSKYPCSLSEYECMSQQKIKKNKANLAELGLLVPLAPRTKTNRKKREAMQDDVVRQVQPKRNIKIPTSYKDLDDPVISKRMQTINYPDTREEDTASKRMRIEDEAEYSPSDSDYDDVDVDEDELESYL